MGLSLRFAMLCWAGVVCVPAGLLQAASFSVNPAADAFVSSAQPANSYGSGGALAVSAAGLANGEFQSLLRFDLSAAKSSFDATFGAGLWSVQSAALQLTAASPINGLFNASAAGQIGVGWMQNDSWPEGSGTPMAPGNDGVTYGTLPSFLSGGDQALGNLAFSGATSGTTSYSLVLTPGLAGDVSGGQLAGLRLFANDATASGLFNSRSFTTVASRPRLTVTAVAVPEPASWLLALLAACGGLLARRCRG